MIDEAGQAVGQAERREQLEDRRDHHDQRKHLGDQHQPDDPELAAEDEAREGIAGAGRDQRRRTRSSAGDDDAVAEEEREVGMPDHRDVVVELVRDGHRRTPSL